MTGKVGQVEMFEVAPSRRVVVPAGRGAVWGVDPSSLRCAVATIDAAGLRGVSTVSFARVDGAQRLALIYDETRALAREVAALVPPGLVWCEQPSGKTLNLELVYAVGATMAGLYAGVLEACGSPARFESITSSAWKKIACGRGDLYKPKRERGGPPPDPFDYVVLPWAHSLGYIGLSWDEADAYGIAEAARRTVALEQR